MKKLFILMYVFTLTSMPVKAAELEMHAQEAVSHTVRHIVDIIRNESAGQAIGHVAHELDENNPFFHLGHDLGHIGIAFDVGALFARGAISAACATVGSEFVIASISMYGLGFWASLYKPFSMTPVTNPIVERKFKKLSADQLATFYVLGKIAESILIEFKNQGSFSNAYETSMELLQFPTNYNFEKFKIFAKELGFDGDINPEDKISLDPDRISICENAREILSKQLKEHVYYEAGIFGNTMWPADIWGDPDQRETFTGMGLTLWHAAFIYGNRALVQRLDRMKVPMRRDLSEERRWPHEMVPWDVVPKEDREFVYNLIVNSESFQRAVKDEQEAIAKEQEQQRLAQANQHLNNAHAHTKKHVDNPYEQLITVLTALDEFEAASELNPNIRYTPDSPNYHSYQDTINRINTLSRDLGGWLNNPGVMKGVPERLRSRLNLEVVNGKVGYGIYKNGVNGCGGNDRNGGNGGKGNNGNGGDGRNRIADYQSPNFFGNQDGGFSNNYGAPGYGTSNHGAPAIDNWGGHTGRGLEFTVHAKQWQ